jgi:hypothetical protein
MKNVILILGYMQNSIADSGLKHVHYQLCERGYNTNVYKWNVDPIKLVRDFSPEYSVIGFSYGGFTAARLRCNMNLLFLIDAVWRKCKHTPSLKSLNRNKKIYVCGNPKSVYVWRQNIGLIRGHNVYTRKNIPRHDWMLYKRHFNMDKDKFIHQVILSKLL